MNGNIFDLRVVISKDIFYPIKKPNIILEFLKRTRIINGFVQMAVIFIPLAFGILTPRLILRALSLSFINYGIYLYNDYNDREEDLKSKTKRTRNVFCSPKNSRLYKFSVYFMYLVMTLPFIIALFDWVFMPVVMLATGINFVYSDKRIRFRNKPALDIIIHGLWPVIFISPFFIVVKRISTFDKISILVGLFWLSTIGQMRQQIRDYKVDKKNKTNNTTQLFKEKDAKRLMYLNYFSLNLFFILIFAASGRWIPFVMMSLLLLARLTLFKKITKTSIRFFVVYLLVSYYIDYIT